LSKHEEGPEPPHKRQIRVLHILKNVHLFD
jgi:hypothetical protein